MDDGLPSLRNSSAAAEDTPRVVGFDSDAGEEVFAALASTTARATLAALHEEPATSSEIAARVDTSLQNVNYHVEQLGDAGLIQVVDTTYSEKGREMSVYAPANGSLVMFSGTDEQKAGLEAVLARFLGAVGLLAVASLGVQRLFVAGGGTGNELSASASTGAPVPPGAFFFAGGLVVLLAIFGRRYFR